MWNSGNGHGTLFHYTVEVADVRRASGVEEERIREIRTNQSAWDVLKNPNFENIPRSNARRVIDYETERYAIRYNQLMTFVITIRILIPKHLVRSEKVAVQRGNAKLPRKVSLLRLQQPGSVGVSRYPKPDKSSERGVHEFGESAHDVPEVSEHGHGRNEGVP